MNFALWLPALAFLTVRETRFTLLGITLVVVFLCAIPEYLHQRRRKRIIAGLAGTLCPSCGHVLGKEAIGTVTVRIHRWHPAPGHGCSTELAIGNHIGYLSALQSST